MIGWLREFVFYRVVPIVLAIDIALLLLVIVSQIWCLVKYGRLMTWPICSNHYYHQRVVPAMTVHLVTFSDASMERSRQLCAESAKRHGVKIAHEFTQGDLKGQFVEQYRQIFDNPKGVGLWVWKPAIILETMNGLGLVDTAFNLSGNNYIVYADAGVEFINNIHYIIDRMDQDIFLFGNNWEHAHWCKRDVVEEIWPLKPDGLHALKQQSVSAWEYGFDYDGLSWSRFGKQVQASVIFFRVSDYSRRFVKEWLDWCLFEGGRLIDDSPSRTPNHPEFREHRHDQAVLTTMAYRDGLKLHYWPAMYNDGAFTYEKLPEYAGDDYPTLFHHHRRRNHEWEAVA